MKNGEGTPKRLGKHGKTLRGAGTKMAYLCGIAVGFRAGWSLYGALTRSRRARAPELPEQKWPRI